MLGHLVFRFRAALIGPSANREMTNACACRKSNPNILVMQPTQDRTAKNVPGSLNTA
jgi:hypothetical protein